MLLCAGYDYCERFQKSVLKSIFVLVFFVSCYVQFSYSDCKFNSKPEESEEIFKRLRPLQGKTLTATSGDKSGGSFEVGVCSNATTAGAVTYNKTISFGYLTLSSITTGTNYIQLSYEGSACTCINNTLTRWSNIMFICDPHTDCGPVRLLETWPTESLRCSYTFEVPTRYACVTKDGLSSGSIFCILFFTGVGLYLLLGFLYQRLLVGAKGLEQIPNYSFWKDFGNLQADGCDFFCRCGPRQEAQSYRGIDDRLPRDDERDDQLLNM